MPIPDQITSIHVTTLTGIAPDKVAHFIAFAIIAAFLILVLRKFTPFLSVVAASVLAMAWEAVDAFRPCCNSSFGDWMASTLGAMFGFLVIYAIFFEWREGICKTYPPGDPDDPYYGDE